MIFYYIRHGDPIYKPDGLTPLGFEQAEALKYRLCRNGLDKIYASSSNRAILTAKTTAELLKKEIETLDWCNEKYAYDELGLKNDEGFYSWCYNHAHIKKLFRSQEIRNLGENWYDHKAFEGTKLKEGMLRIRNNADEFMLSLGYRNNRQEGFYIEETPNNDRVALFAHEGFGIAFLSALLNIPYPLFSTHFTMCHTGVTVIEFKAEADGTVFPKVLTYSNEAHLYEKRVPLVYNTKI